MPIIKKTTNDLAERGTAVRWSYGVPKPYLQAKTPISVPGGKYTVVEQYEEHGTMSFMIVYNNKNNPKYIIQVREYTRLCVQRLGRK